VRISIPDTETRKGLLFRCENLAVGYGEKTIAQNINIDVDRSEHVAILGDNGQGKTTFLKTIAQEIPLLSGKYKWAPDATIAYYAQHVPNALIPTDQVWKHLRRTAPADVNDELILKMAGNFLFHQDDLEKNISMLSGGEKARLCLASILLSKCRILLLDEPTNHLDFETVEALGIALENFKGTIFFISHNRTFVNSIATMILEVKDGAVRRYPGTYEDYIYHLEQMIDEQENENNQQIAINSTTPLKIYDEKKEQFAKLKIEKKKLKKIEDEIASLEKEKISLHRKQTKNPETFSKEDYEVFGKLLKQIQDKEEEWLATQTNIENLSN
jgi:ATP-binding cassette subfamily F protein 3